MCSLYPCLLSPFFPPLRTYCLTVVLLWSPVYLILSPCISWGLWALNPLTLGAGSRCFPKNAGKKTSWPLQFTYGNRLEEENSQMKKRLNHQLILLEPLPCSARIEGRLLALLVIICSFECFLFHIIIVSTETTRESADNLLELIMFSKVARASLCFPYILGYRTSLKN